MQKKKSPIQNSQTGVTGYHHTVYTGANSTFNFPAPLSFFLFFYFASFSCSRQGAFLWICLYVSICRSRTGLPARLPMCKPVNRLWHMRDGLFFWVARRESWSVWCCWLQSVGLISRGVAAESGTFSSLTWWLKNCEKCQLCVMFPINWKVMSGKIWHYCHNYLSPFCKVDFVLVAWAAIRLFPFCCRWL